MLRILDFRVHSLKEATSLIRTTMFSRPPPVYETETVNESLQTSFTVPQYSLPPLSTMRMQLLEPLRLTDLPSIFLRASFNFFSNFFMMCFSLVLSTVKEFNPHSDCQQVNYFPYSVLNYTPFKELTLLYGYIIVKSICQ